METLLQDIVAVLAISNPLGALPVFLAVTERRGLVILLMGLEMLHGAPTRVQHDDEHQSTSDQLLVPLAMPLLAGPGAITTVLTLASRAASWRDTL